MFKRKQSGPTGGDCTAIYSIELCQKYTLEGFIKEVLQEYPDEWGFFELREEHHVRPFKVIEYKHGKLVGEIPAEIANVPISCTKSDGGWSNMDYTIRIWR